jgi:hypothetical protein
MSLSVNQMILDLRKHTGLDITDLSDPDAILLLNRSWWEIMDKFDFREKEQTYNFNTVAGTKSYNVPAPFDAMTGLSIEDPNTKQHTPLEREDIADYEKEYINTTAAYGVPFKYYRENNTVVLRNTPDAVYTIIMKYLTTLADLAAGNTPQIPQSWHEIILYGGIYRGFLGIGAKADATFWLQLQANGISSIVPTKSKEEVDNRYSGLQVLRKRPSDDVSAGRRIN